jgi:hypothetical protein
LEEKKTLRKSNKYLARMQKRIQKHVAAERTVQATELGVMMLQRSRVFTTYVLGKCSKGFFYELSEMKLWGYLNEYIEKVRNLEHRVTVKRFYLDKGIEREGKATGKFRPIGAPNLSAKMLFKGIEIILREVLEPKIGKYQHGFMRRRGTQTASMELLRSLRSNKALRVSEFDLKSFFNKVNVIRTC